MKLHQLYESEDRFPTLDAFIESVKPYLDLCMTSGTNRVLWHGSHSINSRRFLYDFKLRQDPRDTPRHVFDAYNAWAKDKYGIEPRKWLFCYPNRSVPSEYGMPHAIFPVGEFEWFKVNGEEDFFITFSARVRNSSMGEQEALYDMLNTAHSENRIVHNKRFDLVINDFTEEVMIFGTKFYAFDSASLLTVINQDLKNEALTRYVEYLRKAMRVG